MHHQSAPMSEAMLSQLMAYDTQLANVTLQHSQQAYAQLPVPYLHPVSGPELTTQLPYFSTASLSHTQHIPDAQQVRDVNLSGHRLSFTDLLATSMSNLSLQAGPSISVVPGQHMSRHVPNLQEWLQYTTETVLVLRSVLQQLLRRVAPTAQNEQDRRMIIAAIEHVVREENPKFRIASYGSFLSGLYTKSSDLDLTIVTGGPNPAKCNSTEACNTLRRVEARLKDSKVIGPWESELRLHARIPLVVFKVHHAGIHCDLSYNNTDGVIKSIMLRDLGRIEPRFSQLFQLVKLWAKSQGINDPVNGTLNSWSLALMVIFHLQTVQPAVLPPLKELFTGVPGCSRLLMQDANGPSRRHYDARVEAHVGYGAQNQASLEELFAFFFTRYHRVLHSLWSGESSSTLRVCTWRGEWRAMKWHKPVLLPIEDPFEERDNCARTVDDEGFIRLLHTFATTCNKFQQVSTPQDLPELIRFLFGSLQV